MPAAPRPHRLAAVGLILLSAVIWPCTDAVAKHLALQGVPTNQLAWGRYAAGSLLLAPVVALRHGGRALLPPLRGWHLLRVALPVLVTVFLFAGLAHMPFAAASALLFVNPLLITALSGPALGERVGVARWLAVALGFAGALLVIRPGAGVFQWTSVAPLAAAFAFAGAAVLNRKLKGDVPPVATTFHYGVVAVIALLPMAAAGAWRPFDAALVGWIFLMAVLGGVALWSIVLAYERAEASTLAPFHYAELACATVLGVIVFGEIPDAVTTAGIAVIIAAGLWVVLRPAARAAAAEAERASS
jgi:drug/metabolite transporter (DMT)-like permease